MSEAGGPAEPAREQQQPPQPRPPHDEAAGREAGHAGEPHRAVPPQGQGGSGAAAAGGPGQPEDRILIAEDDPWDAELAKRLLSGAGLRFTAVVVDSREDFTGQLDSFRPDVVVSDYTMPGFSGADVVRIVSERRPDLPVIIWSGVLGDEAAVELIKQGATDYVLKDRPARLGSAVGRAIGERRLRMRLTEIESQLNQAQRLASMGRLAAASREVTRTRRMLAAVRSEVDQAGAARPVAPS